MSITHTPATIKTQLQNDIAAANAATHAGDATIHDAVNSLIAGYGQSSVFKELTVKENGVFTPAEGVDGFDRVTVEVEGQSAPLYIAPSGAMYTPIYANDPNNIPTSVYRYSTNLLRGAEHLEEATFYGWANIISTRNNNPVGNNPILRKLHLPNFRATGLGVASNNSYIVEESCSELVDVTLGGIGDPVVGTMYANALKGCTNSDAVITVYVDYATLAEAQAFHSNAPWGATNATIVYRNSTTGEVLSA